MLITAAHHSCCSGFFGTKESKAGNFFLHVCRYVGWLLIAAVYHLPSFQSMGVDMRMNLSLFLTLFLASVLALLLFHIGFLGLWYLGFAARLAGKRPEILTIVQNSTVKPHFELS
jgi:hypothetical protein